MTIRNSYIRLIIAALLPIATLTAAAQVEVEASIDSVAMFIGEQTDLKLKVEAAKDAKITLPAIGAGSYITPGVEVIEEHQPDTIESDGRLQLTKKFTITSFDEDIYVIPPLKVKVDGKDYSTRQIALKILTLEVDTLHPENFYPPKSIQNNPFLWSEWRVLAWCAVAAILLGALVFWLWKRLKENKPIISVRRFVKRMPPHQRAMQAIEKLKEEKMALSGDQKTYYTRLTDTLRKYIEERFGFSAMEMTSGEIITMLQEKADDASVKELHELFFTADLVKFAKYSTLLGENDTNLVNAIAFIDKTKLDQQATVEEVTPALSESEKTTNKRHRIISAAIIGLSILLATIVAYAAYWLWEITM